MVNNHIADYQEYRVTCDHCNGGGALDMDTEEFRDYLATCSVDDVWQLYKHWKRTGEALCYECWGKGTWIRKG